MIDGKFDLRSPQTIYQQILVNWANWTNAGWETREKSNEVSYQETSRKCKEKVFPKLATRSQPF